MVSAEEEYLLALRTRASLGAGSAQAGEDLVAAARERLKLWDIPEAGDPPARAHREGAAHRHPLHAPMSGVVTKKDVVMGHRVVEGDMPYEITDLSQVWVLADAYESDLGRVKLGTPASLTLQAFPNREFLGKVVFIDPIMDPKSRTAKVRLAFPNPTGELRPEMFGEVTLRTPARTGLSIPTDAIIDSGTQKVVFVSLGEGKFRPREVKIGASDGDRSEVARGALGRGPGGDARQLPGGLRVAAPGLARGARGSGEVIRRIIRFSAEQRWAVLTCAVVLLAHVRSGRCAPSPSMRCPTSRTPRSSSTRAGTGAPTSSRTRSPTPSPPRCSARPGSRPSVASPTSATRFVYVIFEDGTDPYWARTRVLEYLSKITSQLPPGVKTELGPDATSVGWVFQYALVDRSGKHSSDELRSFQDWFLRYALQAVPGVSEVATVGGQVRQYQITVNPNALASYRIPLDAVIQAVRSAATTTWAAGWWRSPAASTWCAAAAT